MLTFMDNGLHSLPVMEELAVHRLLILYTTRSKVSTTAHTTPHYGQQRVPERVQVATLLFLITVVLVVVGVVLFFDDVHRATMTSSDADKIVCVICVMKTRVMRHGGVAESNCVHRHVFHASVGVGLPSGVTLATATTAAHNQNHLERDVTVRKTRGFSNENELFIFLYLLY